MPGYQRQGDHYGRYAQPYDITECPGHGHQREPASHIGFVRELRYHALDDPKVPTDQTIQEAAVVAIIDQRQRLYGGNNSNLRMSAQSERERPKRIVDTTVPKRLNKRMGLRPTWSERRLHWRTVAASATKCNDT